MVAVAVADGQTRQLAAGELTAVATKEAVRRQLCSDVRRLFDDKGNLRPIRALSAEDAALIAGFEVVIKNVARSGLESPGGYQRLSAFTEILERHLHTPNNVLSRSTS
jgi:hypothetical protein